MAQECRANSRANFFAAADLPLMRTLRKKTPIEIITEPRPALWERGNYGTKFGYIPQPMGCQLFCARMRGFFGFGGFCRGFPKMSAKKDAARSPQAPSSSRRVPCRNSPQRCGST